MSKFQNQNKKCYPLRLACKSTALLCKPTKKKVVFDLALAVLPIWNNTFGINWYIVLLPNSVGSTTKTYLPWHTILWKHYICSYLRVLWTKLPREAFKADKNGALRSPHQTPSARGISLTGNHTATQITNHGLVLIAFCSWQIREKSRFWTSNRQIVK